MIRIQTLAATILLSLTLAAFPALAVEPSEVLKDPAQEARARNLSVNLRCVVCQNQSIDDSNAPLARDLRIILRERIKAGDSDKEAIDYIVARYGTFVLLKPPMQLSTLALWFGPAIIFLLAIGAYWTLVHRRSAAVPSDAPVDLTPAEREQLNAIISKGQPT